MSISGSHSLWQSSHFKLTRKEDLKMLSKRAGVYRIFNQENELLYVGKAKDLKARLLYYFKEHPDNARIQQLVSQRAEIVVTFTQGEAQALWLEQNYIQYNRPKYNILLLDDKSYPWICLTAEEYPCLRFHRGERIKKLGKYFGPFQSARAAITTLKLLKRLFYIRQCRGKSRHADKRPCLDHHLGYCSGPCFPGMSCDFAKYRQRIAEVEEFLQGKTQKIVERLAIQMRESSQRQDYSKALDLRDQICAVQQLTDRQTVQVMRSEDSDLLATVSRGDWICIYQLIVRSGKVVGGHPHFLKKSEDLPDEELFWQFIAQFYLQEDPASNTLWKNALREKQWPAILILPLPVKAVEVMQSALHFNEGAALKLEPVGRSTEKRQLSEFALLNAQQALDRELFQTDRRSELFSSLKKMFELPQLQKIDCVDISHHQGAGMVGVVVRLTAGGLSHSDYRKYCLSDLSHSDDCAAIVCTLQRRYQNLPRDSLPDLLIIDGGKAQFLAVQRLFQSWMQDEPAFPKIVILGLSKGRERRRGWEQVWCEKGAISFDRKKLWALLEVRDAAHHYAISQHRKQHSAAIFSNSIEKISGIGPKKYQKLLEFMGGVGRLKGASFDQIKSVPGISNILADRIWRSLHPDPVSTFLWR